MFENKEIEGIGKRFLLIDECFGKETRVALVKKTSSTYVLEDFDYETDHCKLKKGNIYLARVARIEPSLQAIFLDYGEEKHGFLPFSEVHPDYYQISEPAKSTIKTSQIQEVLTSSPDEENPTENTGEEDERITISSHNHKLYKVQQVIKKGQVLLVQLIKDVRGTKGAAFTTYIALAGKYSVFMPKVSGNVRLSKKITDEKERESLKKVVEDLSISEGSSIIVRTAGLGRSKREIKRDYEASARLWQDIQSQSLSLQSPCLVYEEGDLVIRSLRDLYSPEVDQIIVQGESLYKKAKAFLRQLIPSHVKRLKLFRDGEQNLFETFALEEQISSIYDNTVVLPSGGYVVINQTEALVAIDVNSGKATKEKHMEETAIKTNLEAAEAISRHLRLRDLSGLIVIDFIDMPSHRNSQIEKQLKECLKTDRARVQVGKISQFGLLEMSRQRLRQSLFESSSHLCTSCAGQGRMVSVPALALKALRLLDKNIQENTSVVLSCPQEVASFLLNHHRHLMTTIEKERKSSVIINIDPQLAWGLFDLKKTVSVIPVPKPQVDPVNQESTPKKNKSRSKKSRRADLSAEKEVLVKEAVPVLVETSSSALEFSNSVPMISEYSQPPASRDLSLEEVARNMEIKSVKRYRKGRRFTYRSAMHQPSILETSREFLPHTPALDICPDLVVKKAAL